MEASQEKEAFIYKRIVSYEKDNTQEAILNHVRRRVRSGIAVNDTIIYNTMQILPIKS